MFSRRAGANENKSLIPLGAEAGYARRRYFPFLCTLWCTAHLFVVLLLPHISIYPPQSQPASQRTHNQSSSVSAEMNESVHQKAIIAHQDALICIRPHDKGREKALIYTHTRARSAFAARRSLSALAAFTGAHTNNPSTADADELKSPQMQKIFQNFVPGGNKNLFIFDSSSEV